MNQLMVKSPRAPVFLPVLPLTQEPSRDSSDPECNSHVYDLREAFSITKQL